SGYQLVVLISNSHDWALCLQVDNQALQDQIVQLIEDTLLAVPFPKQDPAIPMPERFNGNYRWFWGFMNQCRLLFLILLTGDALDWAFPLLEGRSPVLSNWEAFLCSISTIFDDPHQRLNSQRYHEETQARVRYSCLLCS
uniref:Uncharacterized protein n=1 Tax=Gopherus evgoodei TaxID=1825980 RepID=A0A8C4VHP7_9SAUR